MRFRNAFAPFATCFALAVVFQLSAQAASHHEANALRKCAGLYQGSWIKPKTQKISTGEITEVEPSWPLKLRPWKTGKGDLKGKILCKVVKRGSKAVLNQGNIQVFDRPDDVKIFGPIKAKK